MEVKLEINGRTVSVRDGATIMEAANKLGVYIPHFCYHEKLSVAANCRMCMVDIERAPRAAPACATPVVGGMVVNTESARAKKAQHSVMEFLLINHPLDCPICDQGGECQLQDLAVGYGISRSRYREEKRVVFEKNLGPLISTDMTRCIHCTRCVRFGSEVAGIMELGITGRGEHAEIMPFVEKTVDSELSGNMIDICPVGALTSKPFRYTARSWELTERQVVGAHDCWGSHLVAQVKENKVMRALPSRAPGVQECWISDRDRFSYEGLAASDRVAAPMMRAPGARLLKETSWQRALERLADGVRAAIARHGAEKVGFFVSPRSTCEEAFLLQRIARHLGCQNIDSRLSRRDFRGGDVAGLGLPFSALRDINTALFVGAEPGRELPLLASYLRRRATRKKYFSLSATRIERQVPMREQLVVSPELLAERMVRLVLAAGGGAPEGWNAAGKELELFDAEQQESEAEIQTIVKALRAAGDKGIVWLGDIARASSQYGLLVALAQQLSELLGVQVGVLDDGANGNGARRAGALPGEGGLHTADMLRADLRAVVLLRCEPADFCESALAAKMLAAADFVGVVAPFGGGVAERATVLLPAADFCETDGTYVNGWGDAEYFSAAVTPPGEARPAWKIFRRLGEMLGVADMQFTEAKELHGGVCTGVEFAALLGAVYASPPASGASTGEAVWCGGAPAYGGDMLLRRAPSLRATKQGRAARAARMHPDDMRAAGVGEGARIVIGDGDGEWETTAHSDATLAARTIRFWSPTLVGKSGLSVKAAAVGEEA